LLICGRLGVFLPFHAHRVFVLLVFPCRQPRGGRERSGGGVSRCPEGSVADGAESHDRREM
jgi:hypothetical protein